MTKTIILKQPIKVLGKTVSQLEHDADKITCDDYAEAFALRCESGRAVTAVQEVDPILAMYLGFMAIRACNPNVDIEDLKRIKGMDLVQISNVGRNFILSATKAEAENEQASEDSHQNDLAE